jgi:hypothetical protein
LCEACMPSEQHGMTTHEIVFFTAHHLHVHVLE